MGVAIPRMPQPDQAVLGELAHAIGHALPPSYTEFANLHDGAEPEGNSIITSDNEFAVARFIPAAEAKSRAVAIDGFPAGVILLAEDDCGNYFYIAPETAAVHVWDHEVEGNDELLAQDVFAFIDKLSPFDPAGVTLAPGQVRSAWVDPSFKPTF